MADRQSTEDIIWELRQLSQFDWQHHWPRRAQRAMETALNAITRLEAEHTQLQSRLDTAPHGEKCVLLDGASFAYECDCWKARIR